MKYLWSSYATTITSPRFVALRPTPYLLPTSCAIRKASPPATRRTIITADSISHSLFIARSIVFSESTVVCRITVSGFETYSLPSFRCGSGMLSAFHTVMGSTGSVATCQVHDPTAATMPIQKRMPQNLFHCAKVIVLRFYSSLPCQNSHDANACNRSISSPLTTVAPCAAPFFMKRVWSGLYIRSYRMV